MHENTPLLVFSDDWGRHPSSCQHLIRELLPTREVLWVNTIGTRPPRLDLRTAQRVLEKINHWRIPTTTTSKKNGSNEFKHQLEPTVISPRMWPSFKRPIERQINKKILTRTLTPIIENLRTPPVAVTTLPIVADLVDTLPVAKWIYYCVDDFSVWPSYDGKTMATMEEELVGKISHAVAVSENLAYKLQCKGLETELITHGVDTTFWCAGENRDKFEMDYVSDLEPPYIVFWGVIDKRLDIEWLQSLSDALDKYSERGSIVLIGPQEDPDPNLQRIRRIILKPPLPIGQLPTVASKASVLIMPYKDAPVTRAMQPLKLKEYLATKKPVVIRALPATSQWRDACDTCNTPEIFVNSVLTALKTPINEKQLAARERLTHESWSSKAKQLSRIIELDTKPSIRKPT